MECIVSCRLSVSNDLRVDAERDLRDISASRIEVYPLNKVRIIYMCISYYLHELSTGTAHCTAVIFVVVSSSLVMTLMNDKW